MSSSVSRMAGCGFSVSMSTTATLTASVKFCASVVWQLQSNVTFSSVSSFGVVAVDVAVVVAEEVALADADVVAEDVAVLVADDVYVDVAVVDWVVVRVEESADNKRNSPTARERGSCQMGGAGGRRGWQAPLCRRRAMPRAAQRGPGSKRKWRVESGECGSTGTRDGQASSEGERGGERGRVCTRERERERERQRQGAPRCLVRRLWRRREALRTCR